jgi:hypothetical protein
VYSGQFHQVDPTANKTYTEYNVLRSDGSWLQDQRWDWLDATRGRWLHAHKATGQPCEVFLSEAPSDLAGFCAGM